jgi:hypothetical protein
MQGFSQQRCGSDNKLWNWVSFWDQVSAGIITTTEHISKVSWRSYYISESPADRLIHIITTTMRFLELFVLTIIAALIASVSASDAAAEHCPTFCLHNRHCNACPKPKCVSTFLNLTTRLTGMVSVTICMLRALNNVFAPEQICCHTRNGDFGRGDLRSAFANERDNLYCVNGMCKDTHS